MRKPFRIDLKKTRKEKNNGKIAKYIENRFKINSVPEGD